MTPEQRAEKLICAKWEAPNTPVALAVFRQEIAAEIRAAVTEAISEQATINSNLRIAIEENLKVAKAEVWTDAMLFHKAELEHAVEEAKRECDCFHANNEDVALLARAQAFEEAAKICEEQIVWTPDHVALLVQRIRARAKQLEEL